MERDRNSKVISIVALCLAVVAVTLGFAAFSTSLKISSSANVSPEASTFNVDFSSTSESVTTGPISPVKSPEEITAGTGTIDNGSDPKITGLSATFTEPGQKVTYTFYARNEGEYTAFLKSINYSNTPSGNSPKKCTAGSGSTDSLVQAACDDITLSIKVGTEEKVTGTTASITGHSLVKDTSEEIIVEIEYKAEGDKADGDFDVSFGDISLTYSSID